MLKYGYLFFTLKINKINLLLLILTHLSFPTRHLKPSHKNGSEILFVKAGRENTQTESAATFPQLLKLLKNFFGQMLFSGSETLDGCLESGGT